MKEIHLNQYGKVAILAADYFIKKKEPTLQKAWNKALQEANIKNPHHCPKMFFLSLCQEGFIEGIPKWASIECEPRENREHAIKAATNIDFETNEFNNALQIWNSLNTGVKHNGQVDVLGGLSKCKLLRK